MRSLMLLTIAVLARVGFADTVLTRTVHTEAFLMAGEETPAKDTQHMTWIGKQRMRVESDDMVMLVRLDQRKLYLLDARQKAASVIDLPFDIKKYVPTEVASLIEKNAPFATVTAYEETRKIGAWNTRRYTVTIMSPNGLSSKEEVWTTKDLEIDFTEYAAMNHQVSTLRGGGGTLAEEMKRLDGVPVMTSRVRMVNGTEIRSRDELVSVEKKDAPEGVFDVPADYVQKPFDPMTEMRGRRAPAKH